MERDAEDLRELLALLEKVDRRALGAVMTVELPSYEQQVTLGLFVATWEVFRGVRALVERYLAEEALMLSRTLLEDTARLMWFAREPSELESRAIRYGLTSAKYARSGASAARANGWPWAEEMFEEQGKEIAKLRRAAEKLGLGTEPEDFPKTWELLVELKQSRLDYWYARASQSVHSTVIGISARIPPGEREGESNQIMLRSPLDEVARVGIIAGEFFITSLHAASRLLPWDGSDEIFRFGEEMTERFRSLFSRITGKPVSDGEADPGSSVVHG